MLPLCPVGFVAVVGQTEHPPRRLVAVVSAAGEQFDLDLQPSSENCTGSSGPHACLLHAPHHRHRTRSGSGRTTQPRAWVWSLFVWCRWPVFTLRLHTEATSTQPVCLSSHQQD